MRHSFRTVSSVFLTVFAFAVPCVVLAHGSNEGEGEGSFSVSECLVMPNSAARNACYDAHCEFDRPCALSLVTAATEADGPQAGIDVLTDLIERGRYDVTGDGHDIAHVVGRATERTYGGTWESYKACPVGYFLGCQHGFFESMLADSPDAASAAKEICADAPRDQRSFCFHGMGHGLLMSTAYDVQRALDACDKLKGTVALHGCYTGIFMENINAAGRGQARSGVFRTDDLLAPCNTLDEKYKLACYAQHADYLLRTLSGSLSAVSRSCNTIPNERQRIACVRHLGQGMSTMEAQDTFGLTASGTSAAENVLTLCGEFAPEDRDICYDGAVQNFFLYDRVEDALEFCRISPLETCWSVVADYAIRTTFPPAKRGLACDSLPALRARFACRHPSVIFGFQLAWPFVLIAGFSAILISLRVGRKISTQETVSQGE